jgi:hypothetical protein
MRMRLVIAQAKPDAIPVHGRQTRQKLAAQLL